MEMVHSIEKVMEKWFKQLPFHLPEKARKWLGENMWWIVIVGVVFSIWSIINSLRALFWADTILQQAREFAAAMGVSVPNNALIDIALWVNIIAFAVSISIEALAIKPLRSMKKKGWDLLLLAMVVSIAGSLVSALLNGAIVEAIIGTVLGVAIGGFLLFEIRGQFLPAKKEHPKK